MIDEVRSLYESGGGTQFNPARHVVMDCQYIEALREHTDRTDIVLIRHLIHGTYIIAIWLDDPEDGSGSGYFMELETLQHHPDHYGKGNHPPSDRPSLSYMALRLQPSARSPLHEYNEQLAREEHRKQSSIDDEEREAESLAAFFDRKGPRFASLAAGLRSGELGYAGLDENPALLEAITNQMIDIAKGTDRASIRVTHKIGD